jgi:hypothetical protein
MRARDAGAGAACRCRGLVAAKSVRVGVRGRSSFSAGSWEPSDHTRRSSGFARGPPGDGVGVLRGENARGRRTGFPRRGRRCPSRRPCGVRRQNRCFVLSAWRAVRVGSPPAPFGCATRLETVGRAGEGPTPRQLEIAPIGLSAARWARGVRRTARWGRLRGALLFHVKPAGGEPLVAELGRMRTWARGTNRRD